MKLFLNFSKDIERELIGERRRTNWNRVGDLALLSPINFFTGLGGEFTRKNIAWFFFIDT